MTIEEINGIMAALGAADDDVMAVLANDDNEWVIRYADGDVEVTWVEGEGRLVFSALCGLAPPHRIAAVNTMLLRFNAIWRDTGSLRMALSGDEGEVLLIADMSAARVNTQHAALIARNVAARSAAWRMIVEAGAPNDAPPADEYSEAQIFRA